jgi:hypothetical protein
VFKKKRKSRPSPNNKKTGLTYHHLSLTPGPPKIKTIYRDWLRGAPSSARWSGLPQP